MSGYRWRGEDQQRAREVAETLAIAREIAASRVPEWEPWMTVERGYAGVPEWYIEEDGRKYSRATGMRWNDIGRDR